MFQTAQVSWMSRWVPERQIKEKNSYTAYLAMFPLGQRDSLIKIMASQCFQWRFRWSFDTTNLRGECDWVGLYRIALWEYFRWRSKTRPRLHNEPRYKQCFFDYFGIYVTSRFHCIELRRSSESSDTSLVAGLHICHARSLRRSCSLWCHLLKCCL